MALNPNDITALKVNIHKATPEQLLALRDIVTNEVTQRSKSFLKELSALLELSEIEQLVVHQACLTASLEQVNKQLCNVNRAVREKTHEHTLKQGSSPVLREQRCKMAAVRIQKTIKTLAFKV